jgi:acyl dehydratase
LWARDAVSASIELERMPPAGPLYRRAIAGALPIGRRPARDAPLPDTELTVRGIRVDRDHLRRYAHVCGFRLKDALPPTYPHVLAFPLSLALMTRADFPFPLVGLVHIANAIEVVRPLDTSVVLDLTVRAENLREHERGRAVDLVAVATVDGDEVWRGRSAYLRKESRSNRERGGEKPSPATEAPPISALWRIGTEVGSAYAEVSGDRNPIHTSTIAAKAFGFPRRIAHGMWTKARCLAALEGRLPDRYAVEVAFGRPVLLPSTVALSSAHTNGGWSFGLHDPMTSGRRHLTGTVAE